MDEISQKWLCSTNSDGFMPNSARKLLLLQVRIMVFAIVCLQKDQK